jgi:ribosomal-protein-alanine N-acetyltransferase
VRDATARPFIRPARAGDLGSVLALDRQTPTAPHWTENTYRELLGAASLPVGNLLRCAFIAERAAELLGSESIHGSHPDDALREPHAILGFAIGAVQRSAKEREAELESVVVEPEWRRRGVGRLLCTAVLDWAAGQGAEIVRLEVRAHSAGPQALYRQLGFTVAGVRPRYYTHPDDDAVCLQRALADAPARTES